MPEFQDRRPRTEMRIPAHNIHADDHMVHEDGSSSRVRYVDSVAREPGDERRGLPLNIGMYPGGGRDLVQVEASTKHTVHRLSSKLTPPGYTGPSEAELAEGRKYR